MRVALKLEKKTMNTKKPIQPTSKASFLLPQFQNDSGKKVQQNQANIYTKHLYTQTDRKYIV